jgi:hypothetical protein
MAVRLRALLTGRVLLLENIIFLLLVLISVRGWVNSTQPLRYPMSPILLALTSLMCTRGVVCFQWGYRSRGLGSIPEATRFSSEVVERGPLSLVNTTEELLEIKSSGSDIESREYGRRDPSRCQRGTFYPQKLALTSPTSGGSSVGVVRSRTQATGVFTSRSFLGNCTLPGGLCAPVTRRAMLAGEWAPGRAPITDRAKGTGQIGVWLWGWW